MDTRSETSSSLFTETSSLSALLISAWGYAKQNPSALLVLLLFAYLIQIVYYVAFHPLSNIPGPPVASFSKLWIDMCYFRSTWHDDVLRIHRKYGPVVRIAPNEISFVDASALKTLYAHGTSTIKTHWYESWHIPNMQISFFATQDRDWHKVLRARVSAAYSMSSVLTMEPFMQEIATKLWSNFHNMAESGQTVDLSRFVSYFTFDVVAQLALGGELGFVEKEMDVDNIISSIHDGFYVMANMGHVPLQMWWMNNVVSQWLVKNFGSDQLKAFDNFLNWLGDRVEERMMNGLGDRRKDMMQHFIEMKSVDGPITKGDVMIEGVNILGAGADTTSIAILACLGDIAMHPEAVPRLRQEIDQAYTHLSLARGNELSYNDAAKLPYLAAFIKESMRLHPSIQYQLPRIVPEQGVQVDRYFIPKGVHAGISPRSMNRSQEIFGPDADDFKPERWIPSDEKSEESIKEMSRLLTTFGMGSRSCVGMNIALVETYKFVSQFVRYFNLEVVNKEEPWKTRTQWFAFQANFWVKLKSRQME